MGKYLLNNAIELGRKCDKGLRCCYGAILSHKAPIGDFSPNQSCCSHGSKVLSLANWNALTLQNHLLFLCRWFWNTLKKWILMVIIIFVVAHRLKKCCHKAMNLLWGDLEARCGDSEVWKGRPESPILDLEPKLGVSRSSVVGAHLLKTRKAEDEFTLVLQESGWSVYRVRTETGSPPGNLKSEAATKDQRIGS